MIENHESCRIKHVMKDEHFTPCVVNFESGTAFQGEVENIGCSLFADKNDPRNRITVVSLKDQVFTGKSDSSALCQTLLMIRHRSEKKAILVPVTSSTLSKLNKRENSSARNDSLPKSKSEIRLERFELTKTFGSKRSKRQSEIGERIQGNVVENKDEINDTVSGLKINQEDLQNDENLEELLKILPPCDRNAQVASEVYKVSDFLSEDDRNALKDTAQFLMETPPKEEDQKENRFLGTHYKKLRERNIENIQLLLYADCLLKFLKNTAVDLKKKNCPSVICPFSVSIGRKILREFTVESAAGRTRPTFMKDKAGCFVIALVVKACGPRIDMEDLSPFIKGVNQKKIKQLARAVGLSPMGPGNPNGYVLKIPLPNLPRPSVKRRKM